MWVFLVTGPHPAATHPESPHQSMLRLPGNSEGRGSVSGTRGGTNTYLSHSAGLSKQPCACAGPCSPGPTPRTPWTFGPGDPQGWGLFMLPEVRCGVGRLAPAT